MMLCRHTMLERIAVLCTGFFVCTGLTIHGEVAEEGYHRLVAGVWLLNTFLKSKVASACTERTSYCPIFPTTLNVLLFVPSTALSRHQ